MAGRPKEYRQNFRFNSTMEQELYEETKRLAALYDIMMNTIFQDAAKEFVAKHRNGQSIPRKEPEVPSLLAHCDEVLRYACKVGPDGARKVLENLAFLHKALSAEMRDIELNARKKAETIQTIR